MRWLIFLFDGTWNGRDDVHPTNIRKMFSGFKCEQQVPFYFPGPGNEDENSMLGEILGGMFGYGSWDIRDQALEVFHSVYHEGDRVAVFGYSRGAAIARMFCAKLPCAVSFLGCFDTVGAFRPFQDGRGCLFHDLHVSPNVMQARHAVAIHEDRESFTPNLMNKREGIQEVWFKGVHQDIGGGSEDESLSDYVLEWMMDEALQEGLDYSDLHYPLNPDVHAPWQPVEGVWRREKRRVGVKVHDRWSDEPATLYSDISYT